MKKQAGTPSTSSQIIAGMATYAGRWPAATLAIESLAYQVDHVFVYANEIPFKDLLSGGRHLDSTKVSLVQSEAARGDLGDAGKFYPIFLSQRFDFPFMGMELGATYLICDDDVIYPKGYARLMQKKLAQYEGCAVGFHGKVVKGKITGYHTDRINLEWHHFKQDLARDTPVSILSTNAAAVALHGAALTLPMQEFVAFRNQSDLHFNAHLQARGVPRICLAHRGSYLEHNPEVDLTDSIWTASRSFDGRITDFVNERDWTLLKP